MKMRSLKNKKLFLDNYLNEYLTSKSFNLMVENQTDGEVVSFNITEKINPKEIITVIIPTFNRLEHLLQCLNGILIQTYTNYEIIIVDDSSNDETKRYFESKKNNKIKYFKNDRNLGVGLNRQKGYNLSNGKYVIFMDDDDYFIDENYFSDIIKIFKDERINSICSDSYSHYEKENTYMFNKLNLPQRLNSLSYLEKFQIKYKKPNSSFPIVFRKDILEKADFSNMKMMNDTSLYLRALMVGGITYYNEKIVGIYRIHNKNITFNVKADFTIENFLEKKYIYNYLINNKLIENPLKWYISQIEITGVYFLYGNETKREEINKVLFWIKENVSKILYLKLWFQSYYILLKKNIKQKLR